jgi:pSer/pThr/pTyr-binding forkhead associated (FHA) protein
MAKLVVSLNGKTLQEYPLRKERMTIGRKTGNDIQIDNLAVSGKHALITTILDASFLEDLGSTNGTSINGKLVKKHALKQGDVIGIGKYELRYVNELADLPDEELERTVLIRPESVQSAVSAVQSQIPEKISSPSFPPKEPIPRETLPLGKLQILTGPIAGRQLELVKGLITLGRPGVQVAKIMRQPQGYFLAHVKGNYREESYPIVNGDPIGPRAYQLRDHDIIELAGIKMEFTLI